MRRRDVVLLSLLRAAADENHKAVAILAEVDAETWAKVGNQFVTTCQGPPYCFVAGLGAAVLRPGLTASQRGSPVLV